MTPPLSIGDKVWFDAMRNSFTVRAASDRFAVLSRPFAPKKTVLYCIVDREEKVRGPEDLVFGMGAETDAQCQEMLARCEAGASKVSKRRALPLKIRKYKPMGGTVKSYA